MTNEFKIQRFSEGHEFYTDKITIHEGKEYQCVFGQCIDNEGNFIDYTLERKETLIAEDIYDWDWYYSNANKMTVIRLTKDSSGNDISDRVLELHPANNSFELRGCCAIGTSIDINTPMLLHSRDAITSLFYKLKDYKTGKITYETI